MSSTSTSHFPLLGLVRLVAVGLGFCLPLAQARADEAPGDRCVGAYEDGQRELERGDLTSARKSFLVCASRACPRAMHGDCEGWLDQVWASLPTVVIRAVTPTGEVLTGARVKIDDQPPRAVNGRAIPLNPGQHEVTVEHDTGRSVRQIFVAEGEKLARRDIVVRKHRARDADQALRANVTAPRAGATGVEPPDGSSLSWLLPKLASGGLGVAGVVGGAYFGLRARRGEEGLRGCSPDCTQGAIDSVKRDYRLTNASLGVGLVGFVTLTALLVFGGEEDDPRTALQVGYRLGVGPTLKGRF